MVLVPNLIYIKMNKCTFLIACILLSLFAFGQGYEEFQFVDDYIEDPKNKDDKKAAIAKLIPEIKEISYTIDSENKNFFVLQDNARGTQASVEKEEGLIIPFYKVEKIHHLNKFIINVQQRKNSTASRHINFVTKDTIILKGRILKFLDKNRILIGGRGYGIIDTLGNTIFSGSYEYISQGKNNNIYLARNDTMFYAVSTVIKDLIEPVNQQKWNDWFILEKAGKFGTINDDLSIDIPFI